MAMLTLPKFRCQKCRTQILKQTFMNRTPPDGWRTMHGFILGPNAISAADAMAFQHELASLPEGIGVKAPLFGSPVESDGKFPFFICDACFDPIVAFHAVEREIRDCSYCDFSNDEIRERTPYVLRIRGGTLDSTTQAPPANPAQTSALSDLIDQMCGRTVTEAVARDVELADMLRLCETGANVAGVADGRGRPALQHLVAHDDFAFHSTGDIFYGDDRDLMRHPLPMQTVFHETTHIEQAARILIAFGADIDAPLSPTDETLLQHLAKGGEGANYGCAIALSLKLGADPNRRNADGVCAIDAADATAQDVFTYWKSLQQETTP